MPDFLYSVTIPGPSNFVKEVSFVENEVEAANAVTTADTAMKMEVERVDTETSSQTQRQCVVATRCSSDTPLSSYGEEKIHLLMKIPGSLPLSSLPYSTHRYAGFVAPAPVALPPERRVVKRKYIRCGVAD